jgi:hypothetical protein
VYTYTYIYTYNHMYIYSHLFKSHVHELSRITTQVPEPPPAVFNFILQFSNQLAFLSHSVFMSFIEPMQETQFLEERPRKQ